MSDGGNAGPGEVPAAYAGRSKYDEPGRAAAYAARSARRHEEEWRLLSRLLDRGGWPTDVLDVPCGTGRIAEELLRRGTKVRAADLSPAMREWTERALAGRAGFLGVEAADLETPPAPGAERFDLVLCFRFLHHLPDAAARSRVLAHLAARSRRAVVVSFHHPASVHQVARALRRVVTGRRGDRHAMTLSRLEKEAREAGLRLADHAALGRYLRDLWVARFERDA